MKWHKLGRIYTPEFIHPKLASHATNPLAVQTGDDIYRIFFNGRDASNKSSIGYIDFDIRRRETVGRCERPVFEHGPSGSYYENGVSLGNCYSVNSRTYMLFMGWQNPPADHWRGDIGRLTVEADLSLRLDSAEPLLGSSEIDPISVSYPFAMWTGECYEMWYGSTVTWDDGHGEMIHVINHAASTDGDTWKPTGLAVPFEAGIAQAFSRPWVMQNQDGSSEMWFSYRGGKGTTYRIGYAKQHPDGWLLGLADVGLGTSDSGWDSEMIEYPCVFDHKGARYMLYCGNGNGKTGFGLAVLDA